MMWPVTSVSSASTHNPADGDPTLISVIATSATTVAPYRPFETTTTFIVPDSSNEDAFIRASNAAFPSPEPPVSVTLGTVGQQGSLVGSGSGGSIGIGGIVIGTGGIGPDDLSPPLNLNLGTNWTLSMSPTSDDRTSNTDNDPVRNKCIVYDLLIKCTQQLMKIYYSIKKQIECLNQKST